MKRITITIGKSTAQAIADLAKACSGADKARGGFTTRHFDSVRFAGDVGRRCRNGNHPAWMLGSI